MTSITIGQYIRGDSVLHRLDARIKIVLTVAYVITLFIISGAVSYAAFTAFTLALVIISGVNVKFFIRGMRPMLVIIIFTAVINLFFTSGTPLLTAFGRTWITYEGAAMAFTVLLRLVLLVTGASLLTLTTPPLALTAGIESLLSPLKIIHVPAGDIALMMTIAIRFVPTIADEFEKIKRAQLARGADISSGNLIKRARSLIPLMIPLFISAFRRADELATAMDARCYNGSENRTSLHTPEITKTDIIACVVFVVCAVIMILIRK